MPDVVVLGAGVIGLTSAVCLAEAGYEVLVRTAEPPERTTSAVAGAMCGPTITAPDDPATRWGLLSDVTFRRLATQPDTGIHLARGRLVSNVGDDLPPWAESLPGYAPCRGADLPAQFRVGAWAELPLADMPRYLDYLLMRLGVARVRVTVDPVDSLAEAADTADVVVNCTGTAARHLAGDDSVVAVKGQHVIVDNPGLNSFLYEGGYDPSWTSYFPHGDRVVLGGVALPDDWDLTPDPRIATEILARCIEVEPVLADAAVLRTEVGLRPGRPSVRLAEEPLGDARCIHNYGHGSVGVSLSWGCAQDVLSLVSGRAPA